MRLQVLSFNLMKFALCCLKRTSLGIMSQYLRYVIRLYKMDISVVVPLYNEEESLPELIAWIDKVMIENNFSYEALFVDDGSTDTSWAVITQLKGRRIHSIKAVKFRRNYGKSAALNVAFEAVDRAMW
jgi:cellulose synthase/poly-beta-1,6-N-acetylglucosamine synthase-like glycosyltransferase